MDIKLGPTLSRRTFLYAGTALVALAATGLQSRAFAQGGKQLRWAPHVIPRVIDARVHRSTIEQNVFMQLYDGLVDFDEELNIRPRLATEWEQVDPLTWRFTLREGVTFHNGEAFNAEAVKFSIEQYAELDPPYLYISNWEPGWPPSAEVESELVVLIRTPAPLPNLPRLLMRIGMLPPVATLEPTFGEKPVGTGPFMLAEWRPGESLTLAANPNYWDGAPEVAELRFIPIEDASARMAALQAGEVDYIWNVPLDRIAELEGNFNILRVDRPLTNNLIAFNFNAPNSPVANVQVREALKYAFDGKLIIEALLGGLAVAGTGPTPSAAYGAYDGPGYPDRDIEKAKTLLAEAGYPDGFTLTLIAQPASFTNLTSIVETLQADFAEIGVTLNYEELDQGQMNERADTDTWDIRTDGTTGATGEAVYFYNTAKRNMGFESEAADTLLAQANEAGDTPEREELMAQAMKAWWELVPWLWSFESPLMHASVKELEGVELIPNNWTLMRHAKLV
ncbi:peptide/nickel transport system substrate-binding protein/glutathione transport system substrate-binding protein [Devosia sp. YR412]|uniref:ABC transporter substrate-binding protein n=1 Tax=Devosia sp. YR412 TaxID=1881030 RepID=UPI0008B2D7EA|nr:ABC transporter substrate-binding protein [Devosia sp. YR412]SEQ10695.1 peptide/nickel transport system substrate-binding protein/glutathione transport system substrate-binding protein [Devosia sp. YR412]